LKDGVLVSDLSKMVLYDGTGRAKVTANGKGAVPAIALNFDLANFQAEPFLTDAAGFTRLSGTANADLAITSRGRTERAIVSALAGSGKVKFLNGAISGINLAAMIRNVGSAFLDPSARKTQKTDFAELGGTYRITKGILNNQDLLLKSPLLRLSGKGKVDMPKRTVNYRIEPKIAATTKGQGGSDDAGGIKVPVIVSGPWDNLSYKPDLAGMLGNVAKDPGKALDAVKKLIPGTSSGGTTSSGSGVKLPSLPSPAGTLKKLFGR